MIEQLLEADISMSYWKFVDALLHLQEAHTRITTLLNHSASYTTKEPWKLSFLGIKASTIPVLYTWLKHFKDAIYSKVKIPKFHLFGRLKLVFDVIILNDN